MRQEFNEAINALRARVYDQFGNDQRGIDEELATMACILLKACSFESKHVEQAIDEAMENCERKKLAETKLIRARKAKEYLQAQGVTQKEIDAFIK